MPSNLGLQTLESKGCNLQSIEAHPIAILSVNSRQVRVNCAKLIHRIVNSFWCNCFFYFFGSPYIVRLTRPHELRGWNWANEIGKGHRSIERENACPHFVGFAPLFISCSKRVGRKLIKPIKTGPKTHKKLPHVKDRKKNMSFMGISGKAHKTHKNYTFPRNFS